MPLAFAQAALAIGAGAFDPEAIEEREVREVRAHGSTPEALFAHWINECLYVHEVEGFAWRRIDFAVFDAESRAGAEPMRLHSFLHGSRSSPVGRRPGARSRRSRPEPCPFGPSATSSSSRSQEPESRRARAVSLKRHTRELGPSHLRHR